MLKNIGGNKQKRGEGGNTGHNKNTENIRKSKQKLIKLIKFCTKQYDCQYEPSEHCRRRADSFG